MKQLFIVLAAMIFTLFSVIGCSEKDSGNSTGPDELKAYKLDQFFQMEDLMNLFTADDQDDIIENSIEIRSLFSMLVTAEDGWNWRNRGVRDLKWDEFANGYLIPEDDGKVYFGSFVDLGVNTYNVKYADIIDIYRVFQLVKPDETIALYELNGMNTELVTNHNDVDEAAIKFSDFIPDEITLIDSVIFLAVDGYQKSYSADEFNDGYWLSNSQQSIFPGFPDMPNSKKKFKLLQQIIIFGEMNSVEEPTFGNHADESDHQFAFPENFDDLDYIIWE